jgi:hypothetical protein
MQKILRGICFTFFAIILLSAGLNDAFADNHSNLEVFIKGKKYDSVSDYRLEKLRNAIRASIPESQSNSFALFFKDLSEKLMNEGGVDFSERDLKRICQELYLSLSAEINQGLEYGDVEVLEQILRDSKVSGNDSGPYVIDPQKVKTIIIGPSGSKNHDN